MGTDEAPAADAAGCELTGVGNCTRWASAVAAVKPQHKTTRPHDLLIVLTTDPFAKNGALTKRAEEKKWRVSSISSGGKWVKSGCYQKLTFRPNRCTGSYFLNLSILTEVSVTQSPIFLPKNRAMRRLRRHFP
jgi:hypothetical protein